MPKASPRRGQLVLEGPWTRRAAKLAAARGLDELADRAEKVARQIERRPSAVTPRALEGITFPPEA
jgi:hypothetical protein